MVGLHANEGISRDLNTVGYENHAMGGNIGKWHLKKILEMMMMRGIDLQGHFVMVSEFFECFQDGGLLFHKNGAHHTFFHGNGPIGFLHPVKMDLARITLAIIDSDLGAQFVGHEWRG